MAVSQTEIASNATIASPRCQTGSFTTPAGYRMSAAAADIGANNGGRQQTRRYREPMSVCACRAASKDVGASSAGSGRAVSGVGNPKGSPRTLNVAAVDWMEVIRPHRWARSAEC